MTGSDSMNMTLFRDLMVTHFSLAELQSLCFDLGFSHEELASRTLGETAEALIGYCQRRNLLASLWQRCRQLRPQVEWPDLEALLNEKQQFPQLSSPISPIPAPQGDNYHVTIGGVGRGGQVAVGRNITQVQAAELTPWNNLLAELRAAIQAESASHGTTETEQEVAELERELQAAEPNLANLKRLKDFFEGLGGQVAATAAALFRSEPVKAILQTAAAIATAAALKNFGVG